MKKAYKVTLNLETRIIIDFDNLVHADMSEEVFQNTFEMFADDVFHSHENLVFVEDTEEPYDPVKDEE